MIPQPGTAEIGTPCGTFMKPGTTAGQIRTHVAEADGIALSTSGWGSIASDGPPREFIATTVFRRQPGGGWKVLIDDARGPLVLD